MAFRAEDLSVGVGRDVLTALNVSGSAGELIAVVGPSGAGKSTLLFTLCGELAPRAGSLTLFDRPMNQWTPQTRARHVAVLLQDSNVAFGFTALDVVLLGRSVTATGSPSEEKRRAMASLERVGVSALAHRPCRSLSGGEKQRVQLARVMNQLDEHEASRLLLLDEPTASLDVAAAHVCMEALLDFARSGACVVLSVHDLTLAAQYADRILVVADGQQRAFGPARDALSSQVLSAAFAHEVVVTSSESDARPLVYTPPSPRARRLLASGSSG